MDDWSHAELALALEWQVELGVDEAIAETPIDRYALEAPPAPVAKPTAAKRAAPAVVPEVNPVAEARALAQTANSLEALRAVMEQFEHCDLKRGARSFVFSDGRSDARVMILGEAPGQDEDKQGKPFVGRAGQLLDKMLGAIDLDRTSPDAAAAVYITNVLPWRPPRNREPKPDEIAMLVPFVERHIALAAPDVLVVMGNISCQAVLGRRGITRLRGQWNTAHDLPVLPMFHPAYLLRKPDAKREAWADLLELRAWLNAH